jgi:hypothetical protein
MEVIDTTTADSANINLREGCITEEQITFMTDHCANRHKAAQTSAAGIWGR